MANRQPPHSQFVPAEGKNGLSRLSRRQYQIAEHYANGLTYKQIAAELFISPSTVRNHLATIYRELEIGNKADLVRLVAEAPDVERTAVHANGTRENAKSPAPQPKLGGYELQSWLEALSLGQYIETFAANSIEWQTLPTLDVHDLRTLGVKKIGHQKKLLQAIAALAVNTSSGDVAAEARLSSVQNQPERRHLTVMVCDLVGATTLSERFELEDLSHVIRAYETACARVIAHYDGHIIHAMGGHILVYIGYPQAHEDDAERALRAGLEIIDAVRKIRLQSDDSLQVRIGVASGVVVVDESGPGPEQAVIGQTPDVAGKLLALAEPNALIVDSSIMRLTGETFVYTDLGKHIFKDLNEPLHVWSVQGLQSAANRFERRSARLTPLAGRQAELGLLQDRWAQVSNGEGQVVLLIGEAGIGKSRIAHELLAALDAENERSRCYQCSPYHHNSALYPFIDDLNQQFMRDGNGESRDRFEWLCRLAASTGHKPDQAVPLLATLLSIPLNNHYSPLDLSAEEKKEATLALLSRMTLAGAEDRPLLIVVEDIHWLDPSSKELLLQLTDAVQRLPALLILTSRPGLSAEWPRYAHVTGLTLNRLSREQVLLMANAIAAKTLPPTLHSHIANETDGVPLFVEEMTKAVLESDAVVEQADCYVLASSNALNKIVPTTLQGALMARLDRLGQVKNIAQIGAVIGREFSYELLSAVSDIPEVELRTALDALCAGELIFRRGAPPHSRYIFKHALVQDTTYGSLLRAKRRQLHAHVAQVLEQHFTNTVEREPELLAQHYTGADLYQKAITYWQRAGEFAVQRSANQEAVDHLGKGLDLVCHLPDDPERPQRELELLAQLGPALIAAKGYGAPETAHCFDRARKLIGQVGDSPQLFPVLYGCWVYKLTWAEYPTVRKMAHQFLRIAKERADTGATLTGHRILGFSLSCLGEFAEARANFEQVLALYNREKHASLAYRYGQDPKAAGASMLGWNLWHLGFPDKAVQICDEAVSYAGELNHTNTRGYVETFGAVRIQLFRRDLQGVQHYVNSVMALCEEKKLVFWVGFVKAFQGWVLSEQGHFKEATETIEEGLAAFADTSTSMFKPQSYGLLAQAYAAWHRPDESLRTLDEALAISNDTSEHWITAELYRQKGEVLLQIGGGGDLIESAESCFRKSLKLARRQSAKSFELRTATSLARLWYNCEKKEQALALLQPTYDWFAEGFTTADLVDAKTLLEEMS